MLGLLENEGEGVVEFLVRAEPDELAFADVDLGPEMLCVFPAHLRVQPVSGNDEIELLGIIGGALHLGLEAQLDAELAGARLQQQEQRAPADAAEAVA